MSLSRDNISADNRQLCDFLDEREPTMIQPALSLRKRLRSVLLWAILSILYLVAPGSGLAQGARFDIYLPVIAKTSPMSNPPKIGPITTNLADYSNSQVPTYDKLELTFSVTSLAENLQLPYDSNPPAGLKPALGISVDALFSPDNWQTTYRQPAFYYEEFDHQLKGGQDWLHPTGQAAWKVRFAPSKAGHWQFKLIAKDGGGQAETQPQSFIVAPSANKGFIRVSPNDPRYFEFDNGDLFLGLGYNLTYGQISWGNPTENEARFATLQQDGLQLFRAWLSQYGLFTSAWNGWNTPLEGHANYIPYEGLGGAYAYPGSDVAMNLLWNENPGMFLGFLKEGPAVKRNTTYHLTIRYLIPEPLNGPRIAGHPYGLVAKTGGWLAGSDPWPANIYGFVDPGTGTIVSDYAHQSPTDSAGKPQWATLQGELTTGNEDFLPYFYMVMENIKDGSTANGTGNVVYIDRVELRETLGSGQYGPNIIPKPWMAHHLYFEQRGSYNFDKVLELAEAHDLYFKLVILEKNDWILNRFDNQGNLIPDDLRCQDNDSNNDPAKCPGNDWFYGNGRQMTKTRWLQQAWWRYLQARWGYSPHIHSWELLNEGNPGSELHYVLADEFGKYMHQFAPNDHLVTTSFWNDFPGSAFWANAAYPHIDYADLHAYDENQYDAAENTNYFSMRFGALRPEGAGKPLIRGETGYNQAIGQDSDGVWLHNFIWAGVNAGGMYEQYWWAKEHIEQVDGGNDLRYHYRPYLNFMTGLPLNNGRYQVVVTSSTNPNLRVSGQQDATQKCTHLWVQNKNHTWKHVIDNELISAESGVIKVSGFQAGQSYQVAWWDTYQANLAQQVTKVENLVAQGDGSISITINNLTNDVAFKINPPGGCS